MLNSNKKEIKVFFSWNARQKNVFKYEFLKNAMQCCFARSYYKFMKVLKYSSCYWPFSIMNEYFE